MPQSRRGWWIRFAWVAVVLAVGGTLAYRRATRALPVVVDRAVRGKAVDAIYATGTVEAENRVQVKARAAGALAELLVHAGSQVKKGDLLARIASTAASFDVLRGRSELWAATQQAGKDAPRLGALSAQAESVASELSLAEIDLRRVQSLASAGAVPSSELDRAQARVAGLQSSLRANAAEQRALRVDLDAMRAQKTAQVDVLEARVSDAELRAPLDGVVLARRVEPGEVVSVNQVLFVIGDTRSLILEIDVDEADVARVRDGEEGTRTAVTLLAFPERVFEGRVFEVLPDADRQKKAFLTKVRLAEPPPGMRSGMTAEVNLIVDERDGLLVPSAAESAGQVWVVRDGRSEARSVQTGIRDPLHVEITKGIRDGELVVVEGADALSQGARVTDTLRPLDQRATMPTSAVRSKGTL